MTNMILSLWKSVSIIKIGVLLFRHSVMFDFLWPHGLQHARLPCPSLGVCPNSRPLTWWCHPTISFSVALFSSCPQSFLASGSFPVSWLFTSRDRSIRAPTSASVLSMNIQGWFPLGLTGLISLLFKGELQVKTIMRYYFTLVKMAIIKKSTTNKCWRRCGKKGNLLLC